MKRYFRSYGAAKRHPFLLATPAQLKAVAKRLFAGREALLLHAYRKAARAADPAAAQAAPVPKSATGNPAMARYNRNNRMGSATLNAAALAALHAANGDARKARAFAARAKSGLLFFASEEAPEYHSGLGFLNHIYLVASAFAYDLVWDLADWTGAERDAMRRLLYGRMADLRAHMHSKHLSNHASWSMSRVATTGLLFGDSPLVRETFDGPDSLANRIAHQFFDDGLSYEQSSWGYHCFSIEPDLLVALAGRNAGVSPDPLRLKVRNDLSLTFLGGSTGDYTMPFYPVSTRDFPRPKTKDLRLALTAQFQLLRPDTTCPNIGDYGQPTPPMADHWIPELAWDLYRDRAAARILSFGSRKAEGGHFMPPHLLTLLFGRPLPARPSAASRSAIYPQAGYAVMKSIEGDAYWKSKAIQVVAKFGPFGNGHGHADKLSIDVSGNGKKTCIEEIERVGDRADLWKFWNSTVSHNTIVVGGKSQPGDEEMFALNNSCGRLLCFDRSRGQFTVLLDASDVYSETSLYRRSLTLTDSYLLDVFAVESRSDTTFDSFLHGRGSASVSGATLKPSKLGFAEHGYEFLSDVRGGQGEGDVKARFSDGWSVFIPEAQGAEVFTALAPWLAGADRPVLIVRQRGRSALFVAVHDPSGKAVKKVKCVSAGPGESVALCIHLKGFVDFVALPAATPRAPHWCLRYERRRLDRGGL
jgi:hypothetical protein